jgi:hypothetical protein
MINSPTDKNKRFASKFILTPIQSKHIEPLYSDVAAMVAFYKKSFKAVPYLLKALIVLTPLIVSLT